MARARELRAHTRTQVDVLRESLAQLEVGLAAPEGMGQRAVELLHLLDAVHEELLGLREQGIDLRAESTRLDTIGDKLRGDIARAFAGEVARSVGWEAVRASVTPDRDRWWWFLDELVASRRRSWLRRWLLRVGIVLLTGALLMVAYERFLAPSPETQRKLSLMQRADQHIQVGDINEAIARYEEAATVDPTDPEVQLWLGVLYDDTGQRAAAIEAFRAARKSAPSLVQYFLLRSRVYLQLRMLDQAGSDILAALALDPRSSQGLLLLANLLEEQGYYTEARDLYQVVSVEAEDASLQVLAKVRYGMLLEAGPQLSSRATVTPTVFEGAN